jgi:hypothetical protein
MTKALNLFRKIQLIFSIVVFILVFFVCYHVTGFNITDIQLSRWGVTPPVNWMWNGCLILLGISCFYNIHQYLQYNIQLQFRQTFKILFTLQCVNIILLGLIVAGNITHNIIAYIYFFTLPLTIYMLAFFNRNYMLVREWIIHIVLSSSMMFFPLITLFMFDGKAISETIHIIFFIIWNFFLLKEKAK